MTELDRRSALALFALSGAACLRREPEADANLDRSRLSRASRGALHEARVAQVFDLPRGPAPWPTLDPFLFCVHHRDRYPRGNAQLGPAVPLAGRELGQDFSGKDGFSMYHGRTAPGFPRHPHRGFETVTVVRKGRLDHADSLGAVARYGEGDVQWLTAGAGIQHAEMFPLLDGGHDNELELFQIWLNLPARSKFVAPYFKMFWGPSVPEVEVVDDAGRVVRVAVKAGSLGSHSAPLAPPDSWASDAARGVAIATLAFDESARFVLPGAAPGAQRMLYCLEGEQVRLGGAELSAQRGARLDSHLPIPIENGPGRAELLLLQGAPIGEPVARRGPFVMNTEAELRQAFSDYRRTEFGGWPWSDEAPLHGRDPTRFARHPDGSTDRPT